MARTFEQKYDELPDDDLSSILGQAFDDFGKSIRVMLPCEIVSISPDYKTVNVKILDKDVDNSGNIIDYPIVTNCPIRRPAESGVAYISLPPQIGDPGTIEFFDSNVDDLFINDNPKFDDNEEWHHLSNGLYTSGFNPKNKIFDYSNKNTDLVKKSNNPTMIEEPNDEIWNRQQVLNEDGSYSTTLSTTVEIDNNLIVIPTVYDGSIHTFEDSVQRYLNTGKHLGIFSTSDPLAVEAYTINLHNAQSDYYESYGPITIGLKNKRFILNVDFVGNLTISTDSDISINASHVNINALKTFIDGDLDVSGSIKAGNGATGTYTNSVTAIDGIVTSGS